MARLKLQKPSTVIPYNTIACESALALTEFNYRKKVRLKVATDDEAQKTLTERDAWHENWMWGCFALILHRRYRWRADTIASILSDVRDLHNEIMESTDDYDYAETDKMILQMVYEETGLDIANDYFLEDT